MISRCVNCTARFGFILVTVSPEPSIFTAVFSPYDFSSEPGRTTVQNGEGKICRAPIHRSESDVHYPCACVTESRRGGTVARVGRNGRCELSSTNLAPGTVPLLALKGGRRICKAARHGPRTTAWSAPLLADVPRTPGDYTC